MDARSDVMKQLRDIKNLLALSQWRAVALRQQARRQRDVLASLDAELLRNREAVKRLNDGLIESMSPKAYSRNELMSARGKQAAIRLDIACKKIDEVDLLERRKEAAQQLDAIQRAWAALERRQVKCREQLAWRRHELDVHRELMSDEEIMEGRGHDQHH
jgi:hypothetical protein